MFSFLLNVHLFLLVPGKIWPPFETFKISKSTWILADANISSLFFLMYSYTSLFRFVLFVLNWIETVNQLWPFLPGIMLSCLWKNTPVCMYPKYGRSISNSDREDRSNVKMGKDLKTFSDHSVEKVKWI